MPVKSTQRGDFPQTEFTSAEDANITWGPQTGWPVWGDAAPVSMPTLKVTPKLMSLPMLVPKLALALEHSEAPAGLFERPQQLEAEALAAHKLRV